MKIPRPPITKEHGSWAVLLVPIAVASGVAETFNIKMVLLTLAVLGVFLAYVPAQVLFRSLFGTRHNDEGLFAAKFWLSLYLGIAFVCVAPLLRAGYWFLLVAGVIGSIAFSLNFFLTRNAGKTITSDLVAVFGLTLTAPCTYYVATGQLDPNAALLWLLNALFFGSSVVYVHMKMKAKSLKRDVLSTQERIQLGIYNILYHFAVLVIVLTLGVLHYTPAMLVVVFLPIAIHAVYGTVKLSSTVRFKRLGFLLLGHSIVFGILFSLVNF